MAKITRMAEVEEFYASRLARQVADEIKLKETVDQTPTQFYLGSSIRSAVIRVMIGFPALILFIKYYDSDQIPLWPLIAVAAAVEITRINRRVNALNRLFRLHTERQSELATINSGEQDADDQPPARAEAKGE